MRYSIIYLGLFYFLNMGYSVGQHSIDSLLSAAKKQVYDNPDEAIEIGKMILNDSLLDPNIRINGLFVVSLSYTTKRDYEKAIEYALQSKTLFDRIDPRWQIGSINQIGSLYQELKLYDKAISYLDESLKLIENLKPVDSIPKLLRGPTITLDISSEPLPIISYQTMVIYFSPMSLSTTKYPKISLSQDPRHRPWLAHDQGDVESHKTRRT